MTSADPEASNTLKDPMTIAPRNGSGAAVSEGVFATKLPPYSYQMIQLILLQRIVALK